MVFVYKVEETIKSLRKLQKDAPHIDSKQIQGWIKHDLDELEKAIKDDVEVITLLKGNA